MKIKNKSKEYYYDKFEELFASGEPIINGTTNETFVPEDDEIFRQCYKDTPTRRTFPKFWFVSNKGNLISVCKNKLVWVHKNKRDDSGRYFYKYTVTTDQGESVAKNIEAHNLVWLVFDVEAFGQAEQKLQEKGVYAIGIRTAEGGNVQGHHIDSDSQNNNPSNGKFVTSRVHTMFDTVPAPGATADARHKFMERFGKIMDLENPEGITVYFPGQSYNMKTGEWTTDKSNDITSVKNLVITADFAKQLQTIVSMAVQKENKGE